MPGMRAAMDLDVTDARDRVRAVASRANALERDALKALESLRERYRQDDSDVGRRDIREAEAFLAECEDYASAVGEQSAKAMLRFGEIEKRFAPLYQAAVAELDRSLALFGRFDAIAVSSENRSAASGSAACGTAVGVRRSSAVAGDDGLPVLPSGMQWIALIDLNWDEVPNDLIFKHAPQDQMEAMMRRFADDILPLLRDPRGASRDDLIQLDKIGGRGSAAAWQTLAFAWDCLIGDNDPVVLNAPSSSTGGHYGWTSGRHRALVARRLGWTHIPAKVI